jgi:hypothetical protein
MDDLKSILPKAKVFTFHQYAENTADTLSYLITQLNWLFDENTGYYFCNMGPDYMFLEHMLHAYVFDPVVFKIMQGLNDRLSIAMNACYAIQFPDGNAILPFRRNNGLQTDLDQPLLFIAYGATRYVTYRDIETLEEYDVRIEDGDLTILSENSQKNYLHGMRAYSEQTGPCIYLLFRCCTSGAET